MVSIAPGVPPCPPILGEPNAFSPTVGGQGGRLSSYTTVTIPASRGGTTDLVATDLLTNWLQVGAALRTPRTDGLPIIFIPGAGGSELRAEETFTFWSGLIDQHTFFENSILWLDGWAVWANLTGDPDYMDALALDLDGDLAHPDFYGGRPSRIKVGGPVRQVQVAWIVQDVYQGMINKLESLGYLEDVLLFYYPYDWRKDWAHTDSGLAATIDAVLQTTQMDKVVLMAHSTGGLVARNYLLHYGAGKVDQLITMGTPYLGSPLIGKYLEAGDDMKAHLQPAETWWLAQNFLGLYQLLPHRKRHEGGEIPPSLFMEPLGFLGGIAFPNESLDRQMTDTNGQGRRNRGGSGYMAHHSSRRASRRAAVFTANQNSTTSGPRACAWSSR